MSLKDDKPFWDVFAGGCRDVFFPMGEDEIKTRDKEKEIPFADMKRGGGDDESDGSQENDDIRAGKRSERWFSRMEQLIKDNRNRSIENQKMMGRLDYRTVWIARLLIGVMGAVLAGLVLQHLPL